MRSVKSDTDDDRRTVETVIVHGRPAGVLLELAGGDHLLVVGAHGGGPLTDMPFGSVSHQCLHHVCGPMVIVP